jgi:hypothetical protein
MAGFQKSVTGYTIHVVYCYSQDPEEEEEADEQEDKYETSYTIHVVDCYSKDREDEEMTNYMMRKHRINEAVQFSIS